MAGVEKGYGILPVEFYDVPKDLTRWGVELPVNPATSDFPYSTLVTVTGTPPQVNYPDPATGGYAFAHEGKDDIGLNIEAGPQLFVGSKTNVYVIPVHDKRLVVTAGYTGATPRFLQPSDIGQTVNLAVDPATGFVFADLTTVGTGTQATILEWLYIPGGPMPYDTSLPDNLRKNARIVIQLDPAVCYVP